MQIVGNVFVKRKYECGLCCGRANYVYNLEIQVFILSYALIINDWNLYRATDFSCSFKCCFGFK